MRARTKTLPGQAHRSQRPDLGAKTRVGKDGGLQAAAGGAPVTKPSVGKGTAGRAAAGNASAARFAAFMRHEPTTGETLIARVRLGYPAELVKHAAAYFAVPEKRLLRVIGVSASTGHGHQAQGQPLGPAASERMHRLAIITREAIGVLGEEDRAREWLLRPNLALGDVSPLDLLDTEIGANAVRRTLLTIAEGGVM